MTATEYEALRLSETWLRFPEWKALTKVCQNKVRRWGRRKLMARRAARLFALPPEEWDSAPAPVNNLERWRGRSKDS